VIGPDGRMRGLLDEVAIARELLARSRERPDASTSMVLARPVLDEK